MSKLYRQVCFLPLVVCAVVCIGIFLPSRIAYAVDTSINLKTEPNAWDSCARFVTGSKDQVGVNGYTTWALAWKDVDTDRVAYCAAASQNGGPPSGVVCTYMYAYIASPQITWILDHGYPNTNVIGGQNLTDAEARFVTQCVLWEVVYGHCEFSLRWSDKMYAAFHAMVAEVDQHAAAYESSNRYAVYKYPDESAMWQDVVVPYPSSYVALTKHLSM